MANKAALDYVASHPRLPSPSPLTLQVLEKASRPRCTIAELGEIVRRDPALCAQLLKLVNSAVFSLPRAVTSVDRALGLLGLNRVRSLVLALSLPGLQKGAAPKLGPHWKSWVAASVVARELGLKLRRPDPETDLVAALLCDLGMLVLHEVFPAEYARVLDQPPQVLVHNQCRIEEAVVGVSHADVSAHILRQWHLPEEVTGAIRCHHGAGLEELPEAGRPTARVLHFAGRVGQLEVAPGDPALVRDIVQLAAADFGMGEQELQLFLEPLNAKIEEFAALLKVDVAGRQQYSALFTQATEQLTRLAIETSLDHLRIDREKNRAEEEKSQAERARQAAEDALRKSQEMLRQAQKMEAVGRLAGGIAHDFNNLLTIITGYTEMALAKLPPHDPTRGLIEQVRAAGERAAALTGQLLVFSRKQVLHPAVLDLNEVIRNTGKMIRRLIGEDIELALVPGAKLHPVKADPTQVEQVLLNLLVNARDAMPDGGKITLETSNVVLDETYQEVYPDLRPGSYVRLAVTDTGCGMPEEVMAHIFEPFFTTKEAGRGTGLGLATVYGIVKQSGGLITVYSEPGRGTTFKVYFPRATDSACVPAAASVSPEGLNGDETILLVEDEDMIRKLVKRTLEPFGYQVLEAPSAEEALVVIGRHNAPIHLLLADTILPKMTGPQLAEQLRGLRPGIKVLFTSGYPDEAIVRHGVLGRGVPFLQKPFSTLALARKVREVLN